MLIIFSRIIIKTVQYKTKIDNLIIHKTIYKKTIKWPPKIPCSSLKKISLGAQPFQWATGKQEIQNVVMLMKWKIWISMTSKMSRSNKLILTRGLTRLLSRHIEK